MRAQTHIAASALLVSALAASLRTRGHAREESAVASLAAGETLGKAERGSGATACAQQVHTLLSVSCENATLTVRTSLETITAGSDCAKAPPQAALGRFLGQATIISVTPAALRIENLSGAVVDMPADHPALSEHNAAP